MQKIFMENAKEKIKPIIGALIPFLFVEIMNLFFILMNMEGPFHFIKIKAIFLEIVLVSLISLILLGILKKAKRVITILGVFFLILSIFNQIKFDYTGNPIYLTDVGHLEDINELLLFVHYGFWWRFFYFYIGCFCIETVIFGILIVIGRHLLADEKQNSLKCRFLEVVIPCVILVILAAPIKSLNYFFLQNVFDASGKKYYQRIDSFHYGLLGGMYGSLIESYMQAPLDYDEKKLVEELENVEEDTHNEFGTPNILVVFSESFWDIDQVNEIKFNQTVTPNFNRLKEKGILFDMVSPSYGTLSAQIEYEFLTGANVMYYSQGLIPYMILYKNDSYYNRPSIINELRKNGYYSKIVTPTSPTLYNCKRVYDYMQVDETVFLENISEEYYKGHYLADEYLTDKIISELENKPKDQKLFYMTLTMQAHCPYTKDEYSEYDVWIEKSSMSKELEGVVSSYAQGIHDADAQLGRLYDYIQTFDEPTIIVFYGDHLPQLNYNSDNDAMKLLDFFNTDDELLNTYRLYNTQGLVLANFDLHREDEPILHSGPDMIGTYIINNMDIEISDYYKWLYQNRKNIGTANYYVMVDSNGNLHDTNEIEGELKSIYNLRKNIEYYLFIKKK